MESHKEKILSIIQEQSLSSEENELWGKVIMDIPDELCSDVLKFLETVPNGIRILTDNIKDKDSAIKNFNESEWSAILEKEKDFLKTTSPNFNL